MLPNFVLAPDLLTIQPNTYKLIVGTSPYLEEKQATAQAVVTAPKTKPAPKLTVTSGYKTNGYIQILDKGPQYNNCYAWVKSQRYIPSTRNGNAGTTPTNSSAPAVGAAAVMRGHIALVESFTATTVTIIEANYYHGYKTRRVIPRSIIYGYYI